MKGPLDRRDFLRTAGVALAARALLGPQSAHAAAKPDYSLRIQKAKIQIGPGVEIETTTFNGQIPGPLLRLQLGKPVAIDVTNATQSPDITHWHGLAIDARNDGAMEEGSPIIAPGATQRYSFTPKPAGTRWYHSHATAMDDLTRGTYSGQFGFLLVEGNAQPAAWDHEYNLAIHHWSPHFVPMVETMRQQSANQPLTNGSDVGYRYATIDGHMLGAGEPIRVKRGDRVLLRLLNASATENVILALPGHSFRVVAMDGNAVPRPQTVSVLSLAVAERIDAVVEMDNPGVWILGSTLETERRMGLGIVIEYANQQGKPAWKDSAASEWNYGQFASADAAALAPEETFQLTFRDIGPQKNSKFDTWTINNKSWPDLEPIRVRRGKRYRLVLRNGSGDQHPIHLHRHSFEVVRIGERGMSGLMKDTINVMPLDTVAVDFVADNPGDTLIHCHQQLHMDFGFMQLIRYIE